MTPADLLSLLLLGMAASLGVAVLAGDLLAFGEDPLDLEADERNERCGSCTPTP
jgi:hypothetical protein